MSSQTEELRGAEIMRELGILPKREFGPTPEAILLDGFNEALNEAKRWRKQAQEQEQMFAAAIDDNIRLVELLGEAIDFAEASEDIPDYWIDRAKIASDAAKNEQGKLRKQAQGYREALVTTVKALERLTDGYTDEFEAAAICEKRPICLCFDGRSGSDLCGFCEGREAWAQAQTVLKEAPQ